MPKDVVRAGRLLDPPGVDLPKPPDAVDRLIDTPGLVCVERQAEVGPDGRSDSPDAAQIAFDVRADLQLQVREAGRDGLPRAVRQRFLRVADPAGRRRVRGEAFREQNRLALGLRRLIAAQDCECLCGGECVLDVAEVDACDDLLRRQVDEELPEGLLFQLRVEIPDGVDDRRSREVDDALLRAEPAQLRVGDQAPPQSSEVCHELLDVRSDDVGEEGVDRGDAHLGAAADCERQAVAFETLRVIRFEGDVGRGVVRIGVHRVRARATPGGGKPDVVRDRMDDPHCHERMFLSQR